MKTNSFGYSKKDAEKDNKKKAVISSYIYLNKRIKDIYEELKLYDNKIGYLRAELCRLTNIKNDVYKSFFKKEIELCTMKLKKKWRRK